MGVICLNSHLTSYSSQLLPKAHLPSITSIPKSYTYDTMDYPNFVSNHSISEKIGATNLALLVKASALTSTSTSSFKKIPTRTCPFQASK